MHLIWNKIELASPGTEICEGKNNEKEEKPKTKKIERSEQKLQNAAEKWNIK